MGKFSGTLAILLVATFIALHEITGGLVYVNADEIMIISDSGPPLNAPGSHASILVHDKWLAVREHPLDILKLIENAKGK